MPRLKWSSSVRTMRTSIRLTSTKSPIISTTRSAVSESSHFGVTRLRSTIMGILRRIASEKKAVVIFLMSRDLDVVLRQAINGTSSGAHIQEIYDRTVREMRNVLG